MPAKQRSFAQTLNAVAWSFIGLRRRRDFDEDVGALNPFYVIAGGVLGCALFIALLLGAVRLAVA
ncbi:DUF2970 domain-containing protein [Massilia endophytica]|uniref:DUF2970 domain-containing protein n=1 Tax=Massilia endophytica TaxID=2899220 RepID=UPI001E4A0B1C|nr:DUF2970 domain-containing protein [Massilia endophytica]UGQ47773.1 DUF2970 domain-containing protein [Massilia endophytica]